MPPNHPDPTRGAGGASPGESETTGADGTHGPGDRPVLSNEDALHAVLRATRALLWVAAAEDVALITQTLVEELGGIVAVPGEVPGDALVVDVSFGVGEPRIPVAPPGSRASTLLSRHLPVFMCDAQRVVGLVDRADRLAEDADMDPLTTVANRRVLGRSLGQLHPDDTVIMLDLDHFKEINDTFGHHEGDEVLRRFGRALASTARGTDQVGRYGGEEFMVIVGRAEPEPFLRRLRTEWEQVRPYPITFSAGTAKAGADPIQALDAADRALYRAKQSGRDRWEAACDRDYR